MSIENATQDQKALLAKAIACGAIVNNNGLQTVTLTLAGLEALNRSILAVSSSQKVVLPKAIEMIVNGKGNVSSISRITESQSDCC